MNNILTNTSLNSRFRITMAVGFLGLVAATMPLPHALSNGTGTKTAGCDEIGGHGTTCDLLVGAKARHCVNGGTTLDCSSSKTTCGYFTQVTVPCGDPWVTETPE